MAQCKAQCDRPPAGWRCTREPGHEGPCAAMPTGTIAGGWGDYRRMVMPPAVSSLQLLETRRAFYAGCLHMLHLMRSCAPDTVSEDAGAAYLEARDRELREFYASLDRGEV